jgi:hypothetical protein
MSYIGRIALVGLIGILVVGGCHPREIKGVKHEPLQYEAKVIGKDFDIQKHFRIANHKAYRTPTDLLQVKVEIQNKDDDDLWCDVQVVFYDADRFELEKTNWQPVLFLKQQLTHYETMSLSNKATDYVVMLREPRKSKAK